MSSFVYNDGNFEIEKQNLYEVHIFTFYDIKPAIEQLPK